MPAVSDQSRAAITDYRWFRVGPDGLPRGARNVVWPPTAICTPSTGHSKRSAAANRLFDFAGTPHGPTKYQHISQ